MAAPKTKPPIGKAQRRVLDTLSRGNHKSAVDLRNALGKAGDQGTRATHGVLRRLVDLGFVERDGQNGDPRTKSGAVVRFKITTRGREARKAR